MQRLTIISDFLIKSSGTTILVPGQLSYPKPDFNIHVNKPDDIDTRKLLDLLQSAGLKQQM